METTLLKILSKEKIIPQQSKFTYVESNYKNIISTIATKLFCLKSANGVGDILINLGYPSPSVFDFDNIRRSDIIAILNFVLAKLSLKKLKCKELQDKCFCKFLGAVTDKSSSQGLISEVDHEELEKPVDLAISEIAVYLDIKPNLDFNKFYQAANNKSHQLSQSSSNQSILGKRLLSNYKQEHILNLNAVNSVLSHEYTERKKLQAERLIVTLDSFMYSDKMTRVKDKVLSELSSLRMILPVYTFIPIYNLFGSRSDLFDYEKTNGPNSRLYTKTNINKVKISQVPDRGGRTLEKADVRESPSFFQKRQAPPSENTSVNYAMGTQARGNRSEYKNTRSSGTYGDRGQNFQDNAGVRRRRYG